MEGMNLFDYQAPNEESVDKIKNFRSECKKLANLIKTDIPNSRERSLALTKLEEASMWGNKAIVFTQNN